MKFNSKKIEGTICQICGCALDVDITGLHPISKGHLCDDCYFDVWDEEIEKHGLYSPRKEV